MVIRTKKRKCEGVASCVSRLFEGNAAVTGAGLELEIHDRMRRRFWHGMGSPGDNGRIGRQRTRIGNCNENGIAFGLCMEKLCDGE